MIERLFKYIDAELRKIENALERDFDNFEVGLEYFLINNGFDYFRNEYIHNILFGIKNDIEDKIETNDKIVIYLKELLGHYQREMMQGGVMPSCTNMMANVTKMWKHESNVSVISHLKSLVSIAEYQIKED